LLIIASWSRTRVNAKCPSKKSIAALYAREKSRITASWLILQLSKNRTASGTETKMSFADLHHRTSIVTGAAGGIGRAICEELAKAGSDIALFDIDRSKAETLADEIARTFGVTAKAYQADVRRTDELGRAIDGVVSDFGSIDHLVNAHGIQFLSPFSDFPEDKWTSIQDINLQGVFRTTRAVWAHMIKRKRGRVVNIASVHGLVASELKSAYVAAKHGVVGITRAAAIEGAQCGITVNAICPGAVLTELVLKQGAEYARRSGENISEQAALERIFLDVMPTRRFVEPMEIGQLCVFICCDAARSITGAAIPVDGGWTAR
jgi:3-hydroxybutyrate dehydrogenase